MVYYLGYHMCPKNTNSALLSVPVFEIGDFENHFEAAFAREERKSQLFTPEFAEEVLNELKKYKSGGEISKIGGKQHVSVKSVKQNYPKIGVQTRGFTVRAEPEKIIDEETEVRASRRRIKDKLMKECLKESVEEGKFFLQAVPKKYSMLIFETEKKVYRFKTEEIMQMCYLATPEQELAFEKRLKEMSGNAPIQRTFPDDQVSVGGMMIVGDEAGRRGLI